MNFKMAKYRILSIYLLLAPFAISGCDGGLFGTGDGGPIIDASAEMNGETTNAGSTGADFGNSTADGLSTTDGATSTDATSDVSSGGTTSGMDGGTTFLPTLSENVLFVNDFVTLADQKTLLNIINTSERTINLVHTDSTAGEQRLLGEQGLTSAQAINNVAVSSDTTAIYIQDNSGFEFIGAYGPFTLSPGTLTTLWVSDSANDNDDQNSTMSLPTTVNALVSSTQTSDPTLAKVRVLQASDLSASTPQSNFALLTSGDNPGGVDVEFETLTTGKLASAYVELPAGEFELRVNGVRFSEQRLNLNAGDVYTIVLLDTANPAYLLNVDSDTGN